MTPKTDNHIDTALRSAMECRAERIPALSDDFAQQVMNKMNARKESVKQHRASTPLHYGRGWGWVCSIAASLLIAFLLWPESHKETTTQQEMQPIVAEADPQPVPQPIVEEKKEEVLAEVQPVKQQRKPARKQSIPTEELTLAQAEPMIPAEATSQPQEAPLQLSPLGREPQSFHEASVSTMSVGTDEVDPKMLLYTAEIELEKSTHQRQKAHEKEIQQRNLELLLYLMTNEEESIADGTVKTQKS